MSQHFDCYLACYIRDSSPPEVFDTLRYLLRTHDYTFDPPFDHPFFNGECWREFLAETPRACGPGVNWRRLEVIDHSTLHGQAIQRRSLSFRTCMLDDAFYEEWFSFLDWLVQYSDTEGFVGYY